MSYNCYFQMKVHGEKESINEFMDMLGRRGRFEEDGIGTVRHLSWRSDGKDVAIASGYCMHTLQDGLLGKENGKRDFSDETKRLGLAVEVYGSNSSKMLQEHQYHYHGLLVENESRPYCVMYVGDKEPPEIQALADDFGITEQELNAHIEDGWFAVGGFEHWEFPEIGRLVHENGLAAGRDAGDAAAVMADDHRVKESYPHLSMEESPFSFRGQENLYIYECDFVARGKATVAYNHPLTFAEAFQMAKEQVQAFDPTGTYQVEAPAGDARDIVRCIHMPELDSLSRVSEAEFATPLEETLDIFQAKAGWQGLDARDAVKEFVRFANRVEQSKTRFPLEPGTGDLERRTIAEVTREARRRASVKTCRDKATTPSRMKLPER